MHTNSMLIDFWDDATPWSSGRWETVFGKVGTDPGTEYDWFEEPFYPLTSPVAYLSSVPRDPFAHTIHSVGFGADERGHSYVYCDNNPGGGGYGIPIRPPLQLREHFLVSIGPDGWIGIDSGGGQRGTPYEPSNGVASQGDLVRRGDGGETLDPYGE